jgi:hypothetical protein
MDQRGDQRLYARENSPASERNAARAACGGAAVDEVGDGLGLGEIELVVEEGAFGELAGARRARAECDDAREQQVHDHGPAVALQLQHISPVKECGAGKYSARPWSMGSPRHR